MNRDVLIKELVATLDHWPDFSIGEAPPINVRGAWNTYHGGWQCIALPDTGEEVIDKQAWLEAKNMTREFNPATSSLTPHQQREAAMETGQCSDGRPCGVPPNDGDDAYCAKCPNQPHEADARMLDAQLAADMKQPRYQDITGEDWIDEFARTATVDEFRGAMRFTIGKYNRRVGKKDDVLKEVIKMRDYCQRWEAYERELLK